MNARDQAITSSIEASIENMNEEWKFTYMTLCKTLLTNQMYVAGEDLSAYCRWRGLWEPDTHNRWVGAPLLLTRKNWMEPVKLPVKRNGVLTEIELKVKPNRPTNHMPEVSFYRSLIYDEPKLWTSYGIAS